MKAVLLDIFCLLAAFALVDAGFKPRPFDYDFTGTVNWKHTCLPSTQDQFNQAIGLLHLFWHDEARYVFNQIKTVDPTCAAASWGVAMTYWNPLGYLPSEDDYNLGTAAVEEAITLAANSTVVSQQEVALIAAAHAFFDNHHEVPFEDRVTTFEQRMLTAFNNGPFNTDIASFYALAVLGRAFAYGNQYKVDWDEHRRAGAIAEVVLSLYPSHPGALHYVMHAYDTPALASRGLRYAEYYQAHEVNGQHKHMHFRLYNRLGLWKKLVQASLEVMEVIAWLDKAAPETPIPPPVIEGEEGPFENVTAPVSTVISVTEPAELTDDWLDPASFFQWACLQQAEDASAHSVFAIVASKNVSSQTLDTGLYISQIYLRQFTETESWLALGAIDLPKTFLPSPREYILMHFSLVKGQSHGKNDRVIIRVSVDTIVALNKTLYAEWPSFYRLPLSQLVDLGSYVMASQAWRQYGDGDSVEAVTVLNRVAEIVDTFAPQHMPLAIPLKSIAEMYTMGTASHVDEAVQLFIAAGTAYPNRIDINWGIGAIYQSKGDDWNTQSYYTQLNAICGPAQCATRKFIRQVNQFLRDMDHQMRIDDWGLVLILAGGAFIAVTVSGAVALHYRENPVWRDFLS